MLTDLLVACALVGFVLLAVVSAQRGGMQAHEYLTARAAAQAQTRAAVDLLLTDLRGARSVTLVSGACGVGPVGSGGGSVTTLDLVDQDGQAVSYRLDAPALTRNGVALADGVADLRMWCLDRAGNLTTTPAKVRSVDVRLTARAPTLGLSAVYVPRNWARAVMGSRVRLRNRDL